eukprot:1206341-Pleurochrysis_carterae.AAC.1
MDNCHWATFSCNCLATAANQDSTSRHTEKRTRNGKEPTNTMKRKETLATSSEGAGEGWALFNSPCKADALKQVL